MRADGFGKSVSPRAQKDRAVSSEALPQAAEGRAPNDLGTRHTEGHWLSQAVRLVLGKRGLCFETQVGALEVPRAHIYARRRSHEGEVAVTLSALQHSHLYRRGNR
jgi:hypothetical protein